MIENQMVICRAGTSQVINYSYFVVRMRQHMPAYMNINQQCQDWPRGCVTCSTSSGVPVKWYCIQ